MSTLNALAFSVGVLAGVAVWLFLGPLAGALQIWVAFLAWGSFYHCGGGTAGLRNTVLGTCWGALLGWVSLLVIFAIPLAGSLGLAVWAGIVVAVAVAILVLSAKFEPLSAIPAGVYGFAAMAGFALLTTATLVDLTAARSTNHLLVVILSLVVGALFGYVSETLAKAITRSPASAARAI